MKLYVCSGRAVEQARNSLGYPQLNVKIDATVEEHAIIGGLGSTEVFLDKYKLDAKEIFESIQELL